MDSLVFGGGGAPHLGRGWAPGRGGNPLKGRANHKRTLVNGFIWKPVPIGALGLWVFVAALKVVPKPSLPQNKLAVAFPFRDPLGPLFVTTHFLEQVG